METTIAAISTAMSASGIGIIRISGENAMDVISRIYRSKGGKKKIKEVPTHTIHYGYIYDGEELIDEVLSRIPDSGKYIDVKVNGSNIQVPFRSIVFAEHFSHMIHIHTTKTKELVTRQSFEAFLALLKIEPRFYQCNRGIVINLEHAVDFDGEVFVMDDGNQIPVSQKLVKHARQTFMEFLFQRGH